MSSIINTYESSESDLESVLSNSLPKARRNSAGLKYVCTIDGCNSYFRRLDQLDRHEFHHTGIKKHNCTYDKCEKKYATVTHLKRHVRISHETKVKPPPKTIKCPLNDCTRMFSNKDSLHVHMSQVHENPKTYDCTHCDAKFSHKGKMRRHEISKHTGIYPHNCTKCKRGFFQRWQKEKHEAACKTYPCKDCDLSFEKWTLYLKHCRETKHGRNFTNTCDLCSEKFRKDHDLEKHKATKHTKTEDAEDTVKTFVCEEPGCNRSYAHLRNLRQHKLTKHEGKRFECSVANCNLTFSSTQNLSKHYLRDHLKDDKKGESTKPTKIRKKRKDAGRPIRSVLAKLVYLDVDKNQHSKLRLRSPLTLRTVAQKLAIQDLELNISDASDIPE